MTFETPILLIIFNRKQTTQQVFDQLKILQPKYLYVAADGPRANVSTDQKNCLETRNIIKQINWNCELKTLFRDENLGCTPAVTGAITWFFENVEKGIILEDDCLPNLSFFNYCEELLTKYADNEKIMHISGSNFQFGRTYGEASYYFSKFITCWGWATWRRAWRNFELNCVRQVSENTHTETLHWISDKEYNFNYWKNLFSFHRSGEDDIWDYRWQYCIWTKRGISITPNANMVTNIGYGSMATTSGLNNPDRMKIAEIPASSISEIFHPKHIEINTKADAFTMKIYNPPKYIRRWRKLLKLLRIKN